MSGKKDRERRQLERITQSGKSDMRDLRPTKTETKAVPHESTQVEQNKPIDLWLWLGGVAVGILLYLTAKTPVAVVFWVVVFFFVLLHPVWNFWWIEKSLSRRFAAVTILAIISVGVGYISWPAPPIPSTSLVQSVVPSTKQQSLVSSVPSYIVSAGRGVCGLLMSVAGHHTKSDPFVATPITYLLWVRLFNQTDYKVLVDTYEVQLSNSESGPWVNRFPLHVGFDASYCNYPQESDLTVNTRMLHAMLEAIRSGKNGMKLMLDNNFTVATSSDLSCLRKCTPLEIPALDNNLASEIEPRAMAVGWVAINPPAAERPTLTHQHTFYRLIVHTAIGDFVSSGQIGRKAGAMVYRNDAYLRLEVIDEMDSGHVPLDYVGEERE